MLSFQPGSFDTFVLCHLVLPENNKKPCSEEQGDLYKQQTPPPDSAEAACRQGGVLTITVGGTVPVFRRFAIRLSQGSPRGALPYIFNWLKDISLTMESQWRHVVPLAFAINQRL
jgi:hypothetical protein